MLGREVPRDFDVAPDRPDTSGWEFHGLTREVSAEQLGVVAAQRAHERVVIAE
jgi:hypothetical protein